MPNRISREDSIDCEHINGLSWAAEVFWRRLQNKVDDFGRFVANHELLRAKLFPLRLSKVSSADIAKMLLECEQAGLVSTWTEADGKGYLVMHCWERGRAEQSKFPSPPECICKRLHSFVNKCLQVQASAPDTSDTLTSSNSNSVSDSKRGRELPESLNTPEFRVAWDNWLKDRKLRRKPVTDYAEELQIKKLEPFGSARAISFIELAIEKGWTGIITDDERSTRKKYQGSDGENPRNRRTYNEGVDDSAALLASRLEREAAAIAAETAKRSGQQVATQVARAESDAPQSAANGHHDGTVVQSSML